MSVETINITTIDGTFQIPKDYVISWGIIRDMIKGISGFEENVMVNGEMKQQKMSHNQMVSLLPSDFDISNLPQATSKNLTMLLEWYDYHFKNNDHELFNLEFTNIPVEDKDLIEEGITVLPASYNRVVYVQDNLYKRDKWDYKWVTETFSKLSSAERNALIVFAYSICAGLPATLMTQKMAEILEPMTEEQVNQELSV